MNPGAVPVASPVMKRPSQRGFSVAACVMFCFVVGPRGNRRRACPTRNRRVQPRYPADSFRQVLHLPRPDENRKTAALRHAARARSPSERRPPRDRCRRARGERAVQRISATDAMRMPPVYSGETLSDRENGLLRRWIEQGAEWQQHWSFMPPERPPLPESSDAAWARNPIDCFRPRPAGTRRAEPSPEADKTTLIRRVTLDLTGLPPTPAEVDAFLADTLARRLREGRRPPARLAALRRAHGRSLARRRPLRRHQRLPDRRRARHVALARLGDRRLQPQHAVRPVHASSSSPATCCRNADARPEDRHRLQPQPPRQRRRRHHPRGVSRSSTSSTASRRPRPSGWG